jgi:hypothetical protein
MEYRNIKVVTRADYRQLVSLEREIFPNTTGIFDVACVRHVMHYFSYSILVGKSSGSIESYFSFFPLTKRGFNYCIEKDVTTICHFPVELFRPRRHYLSSVFLEVLATKPNCPYSIKKEGNYILDCQVYSCWLFFQKT